KDDVEKELVRLRHSVEETLAELDQYARRIRSGTRRVRWSACGSVFRQSEAGELPAGVGREEVAVRRADVPRGRGARPAAEYQLVAHELAVVLAQRAGRRAVAGVRDVWAARPHPHVAVERTPVASGVQAFGVEEVAAHFPRRGRRLPLELRRQAGPGPA